MSRQDMKAEAIKRLKALGVSKVAVEEFERNNTVAIFYDYLFGARPRPMDNGTIKRVKEFEEKHGVLVYYVIHSKIKGTLCDYLLYEYFLYVGGDKSRWEDEYYDTCQGFPDAFIYNIGNPELSEISSIGIRYHQGGLLRNSSA